MNHQRESVPTGGPTGGPSGGPPASFTRRPLRRDRKPPPPLILNEIKLTKSKVSQEMIEKFLIEKEKPRESKRKRFMYSPISSSNDSNSNQTSNSYSKTSSSTSDQFPGGEKQFEKISSLLEKLVEEMKDENTIDMPKNLYSILFSELYQIKKHCPLHKNSIDRFEKNIEEHIEIFLKK